MDWRFRKGIVWTAPSTIKILQGDTKHLQKSENQLTLNAVRNEYESTQLILTANEGVNSISLEIENLYHESQVLDKEHFTVYYQKYVYVNDNEYGHREFPDALLPIDVAQASGELVIKKDNHVALWITVYIPKEQPEGLYTGNVVLHIENERLTIPISVNVNDYTLTDDVTARTLFSWRYERIGVGELDSSVEMMQHYYDFFLKYRITLQTLPMESITEEEVQNALRKYYHKITSYCITSGVGDIWNPQDPDYRKNFKTQIFAIAAMSGEACNYFEKAMTYNVDEPGISNGDCKAGFYDTVVELKQMLEECIDEIAKDKSQKYVKFKQLLNWQESILNIPNIIPMGPAFMEWLRIIEHNDRGKEILPYINCVCPGVAVAHDYKVAEIRQFCERNQIRFWWYGCNRPLAPGPTYHISDENLLSARSITWLQHRSGVEGNLYWDAAAYTTEATEFYNQYVDLYEAPYRAVFCTPGDGYLTYPGRKYGIYGPLPSIRLMSIRDGMEEYELLEALKKHYLQLEKKYGNGFSAEACMSLFYKRLRRFEYFMIADGELKLDFNKLRAELLRAVSWIDKGIDFAVQLDGVKNDHAKVSIFADESSKVYIGDKQLVPNENGVYKYVLDLDETETLCTTIEAADGKKYYSERFIEYSYISFDKPRELPACVMEEERVEWIALDSYDAIVGTKLRMGNHFGRLTVEEDVKGEQGKLLKAEVQGDYVYTDKHPYLQFDCLDSMVLTNNLSHFESIEAEIYNDNDEILHVGFELSAFHENGECYKTEQKQYELQPKAWNKCVFSTDEMVERGCDILRVRHMWLLFLEHKKYKNDKSNRFYIRPITAKIKEEKGKGGRER